MSLYSVTSFVFSPLIATLSDSVGRKHVFVLAAVVDAATGIVMGLVPSNWVFIAMMALQGAGDNTMATGNGLIADCASCTL
jgi:MFS family permease